RKSEFQYCAACSMPAKYPHWRTVRMAVVRSVLPTLAAVMLCASTLGAQATGAIHGRVVDSASTQGLSNVNVVIEGTSRGTVTRADGSYDITAVPAGTTRVRARRIG